MDIVYEMKEKVMAGGSITKEEVLILAEEKTGRLAEAADEIRQSFCGNIFDMCTIVNAKSGRCGEDCKFCAQSVRSGCGDVEVYGLMSAQELVKDSEEAGRKGVLRYSMVTSGKRLSVKETDSACEAIKAVVRNLKEKDMDMEICVSFGLLGEEEFKRLREAGVSRIHCNLETSGNYFHKVCTTHTYDEKIATIKAAQRAGLDVCSGGIIGLGESMEDRIDMALTARRLGIRSIPVNFLNPIKGTEFGNNRIIGEEEAVKCIALFRFILPGTFIRLAGGRGLLRNKGYSCFRSGANAAISGDMLTTSGISVERDMQELKNMGYEVRFNG